MNRFIISDGLPYLVCGGKVYACRWDKEGFTVGTEAKINPVPTRTYSDISVKAKCKCLDSIGTGTEGTDMEGMSVAELKEYAKEHDIKLGGARTKDTIISAISEA